MSVLQRRGAALARQTELQVRGLARAYHQGVIPRGTFVASAAAAIAAARARGVALADLSAAVNLSQQLGEPVPPVGLDLGDEFGRLSDSVESVLEADIGYATAPEELALSQQARMGRLGTDATSEALVWGMSAAMGAHAVSGWVAGWVRRTGGKPCPLCHRWADGRIRPVTMEMIRHKGCHCVQQIVPSSPSFAPAQLGFGISA